MDANAGMAKLTACVCQRGSLGRVAFQKVDDEETKKNQLRQVSDRGKRPKCDITKQSDFK